MLYKVPSTTLDAFHKFDLLYFYWKMENILISECEIWSLLFSTTTTLVGSEWLLPMMSLNAGWAWNLHHCCRSFWSLLSLGPACDAVSVSKIFKDAQTLDLFPVSLFQLLLLYVLNRMAWSLTPASLGSIIVKHKDCRFTYSWVWIDWARDCIQLGPWEGDVKTGVGIQEIG